MKLIWASDVHLNFLNEAFRLEFYESIKKAQGDAVIISGDIAGSHNVAHIITEMSDAVGIPVYFVLGNHDYYGSPIKDVKNSVSHLNYLPKEMVPLSDTTILIGVDGWGDCRNGDYDNSRMVMSDWIHIKDLNIPYMKGKEALKIKLQELADKDASLLKRYVKDAIKKGYTKIIIVTHVPAFEEASLYAGRKSGPDGLPFFSSKCLGDSILPLAKSAPKVDFLWLSGHTHSRAKYKPCNNMTVKVAKSEYYLPQIEECFNV